MQTTITATINSNNTLTSNDLSDLNIHEILQLIKAPILVHPYYISNLETQKTEIYFESKRAFETFPKDKKEIIKSYCNYSDNKKAWITKGKTENACYILGKLKEWDFYYQGKVGERLSFAEQIKQKLTRAGFRAERFEARVEKWIEISDKHYNVAKYILSYIPMGQPVLVGHHSEARHRRDLEKVENNMDKFCDALDKSKYYEQKREAALRTAEGKQYEDSAFLGNRIQECEKNLRTYERRLQGKVYQHSEPEPITIKEAAYWKGKENEELEKLEFYQYCLEQCKEKGAKVYNKEMLEGKKYVLIERWWNEIVKLNKTTVAVLNTGYPEREHQIKYAFKYPYHRVKNAR
jgi:hypothetical protein